jgi:hypothetical protein
MAATPPHYFSVCAIFRDEAPYLREWVEFHRLVGAERFYLYDNESTDGSRDVLASFEELGITTVRDWHLRPGQQLAYDDCIERHRNDSRWIAFLDIDEFLFSPTGRSVPQILRDFEEFPGVGVNWANFGTSGHVTKPSGLVIESYLHRNRNPYARRQIKSVVDPRRVVSCGNPHFFHYTEGLAVDENKQPIEGPDFSFTRECSRARLRVNHYAWKSEEERNAKLQRPRADTGELRPRTKPRHGDIEDETILIYLSALREALAQAPA